MDFKVELPEWNNEGITPPKSAKDNGYKPGDKPPAQWFNWAMNRTYKSLDEIREVCNQLELNIKNIDLSDIDNAIADLKKQVALKAEKSYVDNELSKKANTSYVNTELAKKADNTKFNSEISRINGEVNSVKQSGVESNKSLVDALNSKGVLASTNDNIKTNVSKVNQIDTDPSGNTTAVSGDLLQGKTAYSQKKQIVGTMPNVGSQRSAVTKDGYYVAIKEGYHDGTGRVTSRVENLKPDVIKKGAVVGGVVGTYMSNVDIFTQDAYNLDYSFTIKGPGTIYFRLSSFNEYNFDVIIDKSGEYSFRNIGKQADEFYNNPEYFQIDGFTISGRVHMSGVMIIVGVY